MQELNHYINGTQVKGSSGRFADVFNPATGEVQSRVPLASKDEVDAAIAKAAAAQPAWGATNPQKRGRVMMEFVRLINRDMEKLAEALSREHGKTIPDAKGDVQRGLEVIEFCIGAPQMLKGEYTDSAGPGIDMYSMRQPLGVVAGITPFNFPAMIPLWKMGPALACGNAFILKPSERDPSVPLMLADLLKEAGLPDGVLQVINGDKEAVDAILDNETVQAIGFVGSTPIAQYIYARGCAAGKRVQCFGGAKNHMIVMPDADMDQAADALIGAGYGAAGERCMAISVAVPVGDETADATDRKAGAAYRKAEGRALYGGQRRGLRPACDGGSERTGAGAGRIRYRAGAKLVVDGRDFKMQGYEDGFFVGPHLFDHVTTDMDIYTQEIFGPVLSTVRAKTYEEALGYAMDHEYGNGTAIFTRDGDTARDFASPDQHRHGRHQRADPGAAGLSHLRRLEEIRLWRPEPAWSRQFPVLYPDQDRHRALALRSKGRRRVPFQGDGLTVRPARSGYPGKENARPGQPARAFFRSRCLTISFPDPGGMPRRRTVRGDGPKRRRSDRPFREQPSWRPRGSDKV